MVDTDTSYPEEAGGTPDNGGDCDDKHTLDKEGGLIETDTGGMRGIWDRAKASFGHLENRMPHLREDFTSSTPRAVWILILEVRGVMSIDHFDLHFTIDPLLGQLHV